jgi:release factor glutamine methyltransferase
MKIYEAINTASGMLKNIIPEPEIRRFETEEMLINILSIKKEKFYAMMNDQIDLKQLAAFFKAIRRRAKGVPHQYITGIASFYTRDFKVGKGVFIPRQDTEAVIDAVRSFNLPEGTAAAECGPGSGIISVTLLLEVPRISHITAIEKGFRPYRTTAANAKNYGVMSRMTLKHGDFFRIISATRKQFGLIVSNPPYIKRQDLESLQEEVKHEPLMALTDGKNGLSFYKKFEKLGRKKLLRLGYLVFEIGDNMADDVESFFDTEIWQNAGTFKDFKGMDRVMAFQLK